MRTYIWMVDGMVEQTKYASEPRRGSKRGIDISDATNTTLVLIEVYKWSAMELYLQVSCNTIETAPA